MENKFTPGNIDEYISTFPNDVQEILNKLRKLIKSLAPEAGETISYQMPTFTLYGNLVHFAAFKNHIGFYPTPSAITKFNKEISKYKWAKGSVQFPIDEPLPFDLITEIVKFRVNENMGKAAKKTKK